MTPKPYHGGWIIIVTFLIALVLTIVPLPKWIALFRPEWLALLTIYWCMALPQRVGIGYAWTAGIVEDVARDALLGQHALAMTVIAYITLKLHQRIRVFPPWQQALNILVLIALFQLLVVWIQGVIGQPRASWLYWLPSLSSMLVWPWTLMLMRRLRRNFSVG
jgi:rod shape-determining protein MreD